MVSEKNHPGKVSHFMEVYLPLALSQLSHPIIKHVRIKIFKELSPKDYLLLDAAFNVTLIKDSFLE